MFVNLFISLSFYGCFILVSSILTYFYTYIFPLFSNKYSFKITIVYICSMVYLNVKKGENYLSMPVSL